MVAVMPRPDPFVSLLSTRFRLESRLDEGTGTVTCLGRDEDGNGPIVVRAVPDDGVTPEGVAGFLEAVEALKSLEHPGLLPVLEGGHAAGALYWTAPHVPSVSARDKLDAHGVAPPTQTLQILLRVTEALDHAHAHGVFHLALRPESVLLRGSEVLLSGVGIAQALRAAGVGATEPPADPRSDVYLVGALGHELLTGRVPPSFGAPGSQKGGTPGPGATPGVPDTLDDILRRCLAQDREDRWPSMQALATALHGIRATPTLESGGDASAEERPGERIGAYRLLDVLGKGGMGVVYLAEQSEPVRRLVALKLVKPGMDTSEVLARFDSERQAVALMDHPNIAKVFDAGATPTGRPYFVMELVQGPSLTDYCDREGLGIRERIDLFLPLCRAVQHAHQKGVIHRDLKPSNVLVADRDGAPAPVVIDFGLAKAMGPGESVEFTLTYQGQLVGTPTYMSPEQAGQPPMDVDTRSDVYALGVMLYELLCGAVPLEAVESSTDTEVLRKLIRDSEPPRPSSRFQSLADARDQVADRRSTDSATLLGALKGDLDWIILKAMAKEPSQRYETVNALVRDLERYLAHEPVEARAPSTAYRMGKFVRRHRTAVLAGALVASGLVVGLVTTTRLWLRAQAAERQAAVEAETAGQVSDFLINLFEVSDPSQGQGETVTARALLDRAAADVRQGLESEPFLSARFLHTMGRVYMNLGLYDEARDVLETAVALFQDQVGPNDVDAARATNSLASAYMELGRFEEADSLYESAIAASRARGADDADLLNALNNRSILQLRLGRFEEAARTLEEIVSIAKATPAYDPVDLSKLLNNLGLVYRRLGRLDDARAAWERTLAIREKNLDPDDLGNAGVLHNLATLARGEGQLVQAESLALRALGIRERVLGPDHPDLAGVLNTLGSIYVDGERYAEAGAVMKRSLAIREAALGPAHPAVAQVLLNLTDLYVSTDSLVEAEKAATRAHAIWEAAYGPDHPDTGLGLLGRAQVLALLGRTEEAEALFLRALDVLERSLGPDHPYVRSGLDQYVELLRSTGRPREADSVAARAAGGDPGGL